MLIGNKKDKMRREVPYNMAAKFARENNFGFMEVSAKSGSGVKEAFHRLVIEIYRQIYEKLTEEDPDAPKMVIGGPHSSSLSGRNEILRGSLVLDEKLHYARRNQSDSYSYASSKQRSQT